MSSALAALSPEERAEALEALLYRRLDRATVEYGLTRLLDQELVRKIAVPTPAAGAEWTINVPAGVTWELLAVRCTLITSAVVANRTPRIRIQDPDADIPVEFGATSLIAASQTNSLNWSAGYGATNTVISLHAPLPSPPFGVPAAWTIKTVTGSLDVGDAYSAIRLFVRQWSPPDVAHAVRMILTDLDSAGGI